MSKIKLTQKLIATLPKPENKGYVLCDSWYSCKDIFNSSEKAGYGYIGALKLTELFSQKVIKIRNKTSSTCYIIKY